MSKHFTLGRGLGSLIPNAPMSSAPAPAQREESAPSNGLRMIPVGAIEPNPYQPRTEFKEEDIASLADSIREYGILQPLAVVEISTGKYQIIAGERRFRASQRAGLKEVPAVVRPRTDDERMLTMALVENIQRADLNVIEEANSYQQLIDEFGYTQEQVSEAVGKPRATVANVLRVLQLPAQIQMAIADGRLTLGHAKAILSLTDVRKQLALADRVLDENLTVRQTEAAARALVDVNAFVRAKKTARPAELARLEDELRAKYGTKSEVKEKNGQGTIALHFFSQEELTELKKKLLK